MNFVPIKLEVEQAIKDFAIADILKKSEPEKVNFQYAVDHTDIPSDLLNDINSELNSKGIEYRIDRDSSTRFRVELNYKDQ